LDNFLGVFKLSNSAAVITIRPARNVQGSVRLPGDKSISHRYAMLAGIAEGRSRFQNFSTGADCASTIACMQALGCKAERKDGHLEIEGCAGELGSPATALDCGNSGSTIRMLSGIMAGQEFTSELMGDESLSRRPMGRIMAPLRAMGAEIVAHNDRPPLRIRGGNLKAIDYTLPVASAQVKSCVLFAGLFARGETQVEEPVRTRDHGELALRAFGAQLWRRRNRAGITGEQKLHAIEAYVPGDISSAAFFLCAAALLPESNLVFDALLLNPTRAVLLDVLTSLGAKISVLHVEEHHGELVGTVRAQHGSLRGLSIAGAQAAALIDELPVLAAIAPYTEQGIEIHDARELRVKESDRLASVAHNLRAMGAELEEFEDGLRIPGGQTLHGAELDAFGDHRIAMAFAISALRAQGDSTMAGADAARISFPEFFTMLEGIVQR
jgi:3-phosphoshikimate 1-carboxyvinyltransferase